MTTAHLLRNNLGSAMTGRGMSPNIWGDCPILSIIEGTVPGVHFFDDFARGFITPTITTLINVDGYACFGSAGATITWDDSTGGGIVLTEATDDESVSMTWEQHPFWLNSSKGKFWFEARVKLSTVAANHAFVVGMMDTTSLSAAVPVTATGAIADANFVGFHRPEANTTAIDASYKADGVTAVEVNSDIGTLVADTYVKLGMKSDPDDSNKLAFYIDNVKQASTKTLGAAAGTDFPDDIGLAPVIGQTLGASASKTITMDWWRAAQLG